MDKNELKYTFGHSLGIPEPTNFHMHMHNEYEILYFVRGDADFQIEGTTYKLKPRDLLFIRPRTFHYSTPRPSEIYERFVINFSEGLLAPVLDEFVRNAENIYSIPKDSPIDRLFSELSEIKSHVTKEEYKILTRHVAETVTVYLKYLKADEKAEPIAENGTLDAILKYIDDNPTKRITVEDISEKFFISRSWITHAFKKHLGIGLHQYTVKKQILYAEGLIKNGHSPTEVASLCGYSSYITFYRQYKKTLGYIPSRT